MFRSLLPALLLIAPMAHAEVTEEEIEACAQIIEDQPDCAYTLAIHHAGVEGDFPARFELVLSNFTGYELVSAAGIAEEQFERRLDVHNIADEHMAELVTALSDEDRAGATTAPHDLSRRLFDARLFRAVEAFFRTGAKPLDRLEEDQLAYLSLINLEPDAALSQLEANFEAYPQEAEFVVKMLDLSSPALLHALVRGGEVERAAQLTRLVEKKIDESGQDPTRFLQREFERDFTDFGPVNLEGFISLLPDGPLRQHVILRLAREYYRADNPTKALEAIEQLPDNWHSVSGKSPSWLMMRLRRNLAAAQMVQGNSAPADAIRQDLSGDPDELRKFEHLLLIERLKALRQNNHIDEFNSLMASPEFAEIKDVRILNMIFRLGHDAEALALAQTTENRERNVKLVKGWIAMRDGTLAKQGGYLFRLGKTDFADVLRAVRYEKPKNRSEAYFRIYLIAEAVRRAS